MLFRRNVFVLGAGFSADAGAPVMSNFLQRAKSLLDDPQSGLGEFDRGAFTRVFQFLRELRAAQAKLTLDLENIEHLFGLAEMDLEFGGRNRGAFRGDLIFLILRTLERSIRADLPRSGGIVTKEGEQRWSRGVAANYGELFAALASRRWLGGAYGIPQDGLCLDTIITMNYDCFLDDALARLGVRPDYELPEATYPREWMGLPYRINLLKLHGSANWLRCGSESCKGRVYISGEEPAGRLEYFYGRACQECRQQQVEPVIVPPTWAKGSHREVFGPIWTRALRALRQAGRIFIIGYSMPDTDAFFQYMLGLALATNEDIDQVFIVNSNPEIKQKFGRLFNQHFRERRLVPVDLPTLAFVTNQDFGLALGQYREGLNREMIAASGFNVA